MSEMTKTDEARFALPADDLLSLLRAKSGADVLGAGARIAATAAGGRMARIVVAPRHWGAQAFYIGEFPAPSSVKSGPQESATFLGEKPNLERLAELRSKAKTGPLQISEDAVDATEAIVAFAYGRVEYVIWVEVIGPQGLAAPAVRMRIGDLLSGLMHCIAVRFLELLEGDLHMHRMAFYAQILSSDFGRMSKYYAELCNDWRQVMDADWVWLWLHNDYTKRWELLGCDSGQGAVPLPVTRSASERGVAATLAHLKGEPVYIYPLEDWSETWHGQSYHLALAQDYAERGCKAIDLVPLVFPGQDGPGEGERGGLIAPLKIVLSSYYRKPWKRKAHPPDKLLLIGKLTSVAVLVSMFREQRTILLKLNGLAQSYLGRREPEYKKLVTEFSLELIKLIKEYLEVDYVSIFYRTTSERKITLVASTGICDKDGKEVPGKQWPKVSYAASENRTGEVFASGEAFISKIGDSPVSPNPPKYKETPFDESKVAWLIFPIPLAQDGRAGLGEPKAAGVIRCAGNKYQSVGPTPRNFTSLQIENLAYIAQQVATTYEILFSYLRREQVVSVVKHDLQVHPVMIKACVDGLRKKLDALSGFLGEDVGGLCDAISGLSGGATSQVPEGFRAALAEVAKRQPAVQSVIEDAGESKHVLDFHLINLELSETMLKNLIPELGADPATRSAYTPEPVLLEADILAHLVRCLRHFARIKKQMTIRYDSFQKVIPKLHVDPRLVERVFCNLIVNAVKYGDKGSEILIEPRADSRGYWVSVSNRGFGIREQERDLVFSGNYRSEAAVRVATGDGLGLKICKAIMDLHGGAIEVTSCAGPTTISVLFPATLEYEQTKHIAKD